jgi:hypothetical protein
MEINTVVPVTFLPNYFSHACLSIGSFVFMINQEHGSWLEYEGPRRKASWTSLLPVTIKQISEEQLK